MKRLLAGMVVGALAVRAMNKNGSTLKKGKRSVLKKVEDMLNI